MRGFQWLGAVVVHAEGLEEGIGPWAERLKGEEPVGAQ